MKYDFKADEELLTRIHKAWDGIVPKGSRGTYVPNYKKVKSKRRMQKKSRKTLPWAR